VDLALRRHEDGDARGSDLVFLLIDLDHFKRINDSHGHAAGDAAAVLREHLRSLDYVVRWGGEEFLMVARFVDRDEAAARALTCSIGFAAYPFSRLRPRAVGWERVVEVADLALYAAKRDGRNRWVGFDGSDVEEPEVAVRGLQQGEGNASLVLRARQHFSRQRVTSSINRSS